MWGRIILEFLLIGESKIKIVLSEEEAVRYKLSGNSGDLGSGGVRRAFWQVLDLAKAEVGFDPRGDKVLIQLYPIKNGGCELFVTKLGILPESSARLVSKSDRVAMLQRKKSLYSFASLEDLSAAARAVRAAAGEITLTSQVYEAEGRYFLSIEEYGKGGEQVEFPCILEFSTPLTAELSAYITEHSLCLAESQGIELFSSL